jgi:hypothetical protein
MMCACIGRLLWRKNATAYSIHLPHCNNVKNWGLCKTHKHTLNKTPGTGFGSVAYGGQVALNETAEEGELQGG